MKIKEATTLTEKKLTPNGVKGDYKVEDIKRDMMGHRTFKLDWYKVNQQHI